MCYIWHIVNSATFSRARIKGNGMENFLLSHCWVSLGGSHVLTCSQEAECVFKSQAHWEFLMGILLAQRKRKQSNVQLERILLFSFLFLFSWPFQVLTKSITQSEAVFLFNAKYVGWKVHIVWSLGLVMKTIHPPWTMQSVPGNRTWADFRRL